MTVKYKVSDFAKDLNISAKKVLDELAAMLINYYLNNSISFFKYQ